MLPVLREGKSKFAEWSLVHFGGTGEAPARTQFHLDASNFPAALVGVEQTCQKIPRTSEAKAGIRPAFDWDRLSPCPG